MNTDRWLAFTKPCFVFVKIFVQSWPGFNFSLLFFFPVLFGSFSVLRVLWRKWMAMLVFDLHKEHHVSISQPCCYSFSTALTGENRKQREKRRDMCRRSRVGEGGLFVCGGKYSLSPSPSMSLSLFRFLSICCFAGLVIAPLMQTFKAKCWKSHTH